MHRATDAGTLSKTAVLVNNYSQYRSDHSPPATARFAITTFEAPQGATHRGPTPPPYHGLCRPTRVQAVPSSVPDASPRSRSTVRPISLDHFIGEGKQRGR